MHTYQWKNADPHFLHFHKLCIQDLWSLCQWIFDIHRGHACLEFKEMLDSQGPVTKPDWQGVLQCSQPWEHAVIHSLHLFITRTQGVGAYPTMHSAKRKHSSLVAIHHWAHSSFCCTWPGRLWIVWQKPEHQVRSRKLFTEWTEPRNWKHLAVLPQC